MDTGFGNGAGFDQVPTDAIVQADGRVIVAGPFATYNGASHIGIIRFNTDGSVDSTFPNGAGIPVGSVFALALQPDGKILVGGQFGTFNGVARNRLVRLEPDGSVDGSFANPTVTMTNVRDIEVQPNGAILIVGDGRQCRFSSAGVLDNTFTTTTTASGFSVVRVQSDGKVLMAGSFTKGILRRTSVGLTDATFVIGTGFNGAVNDIVIQSDGRIIAVGTFTSYNAIPCNRIARLNPDGSYDAGFAIGAGFNAPANKVLSVGGELLVCGSFDSYDGAVRRRLIRLLANGTVTGTDAGITGLLSMASGITCAVRRPDGELFIAGAIGAINGACRRTCALLNTDYTLDANSFLALGTGANDDVLALAAQPDGKLLLGGDFLAYNGVSAMRLVRVDPEGAVDETFNVGLGFNARVRCIAPLPDGTVLVGGDFTSCDGTACNGIVKLDATGAIDPTFLASSAIAPIGSFTCKLRSILPQSDGTILIGGYFVSASGGHNCIGRLLSTGVWDPSFDPGTGFNAIVLSIAVRATGELLCGGQFSQFNGLASGGIAQLAVDGSLDPGFAPGTGFTGLTPWVYGIVIQPDDKVVAVGWFVTFNGASRRAWVRINTDGSVDPTFTSSPGSSVINAVVAQPDGAFLLGGGYDGTTCRGPFRILSDGTIDPAFAVPVGVGPVSIGPSVYALLNASANKAIIGGTMNTYEGAGRNGIARVWTGAPEPVRLAPRAYLGGAYDGVSGLMNDALRANGSVPLTEPFTALGALHVGGGGGEMIQPAVLGTTGPDAIVDWVLLELRAAGDPAAVIATRSAVLQRDGDVVDVDGVSPVAYNVAPGNYHVALRHRNHLAVMSANAYGLSAAPVSVDLSLGSTPAYGTNARQLVGSAMVLWAGDANGDGTLSYIGANNDRDPILTAVGGTTPNNTVNNVYDRRDVNLDGVVRYTGTNNDRDPILTNVGSTTPNNTRVQQLP